MKIGKVIAVIGSCLVVLGTVFVLFFQQNEKHSNLSSPHLEVKANKEEIAAKKGAYCWSENEQSVCTDTEDPASNLDQSYEIHAVSDLEAELVFNNSPEKIEIERRDEDGRWEKQLMKDNSYFQLPDSEGTYVYRVAAQWEQGNVTYAFRVVTE
ncbi:hypothetical protein SAMN05421503_0142 [Terribacillus aidingensis]|uniref:Uncharacterized protein n=1 Tax=Terribacillus aidingensis TaxID=586416 RepID=A0A285N3J7_9BACI|nr:hypothetical protein [Terribacillus aidingensis]SNZ02566.1 hypothetical protein SAMN05421503_0142 [Terribacillus aidingensis]